MGPCTDWNPRHGEAWRGTHTETHGEHQQIRAWPVYSHQANDSLGSSDATAVHACSRQLCRASALLSLSRWLSLSLFVCLCIIPPLSRSFSRPFSLATLAPPTTTTILDVDAKCQRCAMPVAPAAPRPSQPSGRSRRTRATTRLEGRVEEEGRGSVVVVDDGDGAVRVHRGAVNAFILELGRTAVRPYTTAG